MVLQFNPIDYFASIFDIVSYVDLDKHNLKWYAFEKKGVTANFKDDDSMMIIKLDDIITVDGQYVQSMKLICPIAKIENCKQIIAEAQLEIVYLEDTTQIKEEQGLTEISFYVKGDFISTDVEAEQIG